MSALEDSGHKETNLTQTSIIFYFLIGGALLVSPLVVVSNWNPQVCSSNSLGQQKCSTPIVYSQTVSFLPFMMVVGGLLIGYNMKRISDSLRPHDEVESGVEESS